MHTFLLCPRFWPEFLPLYPTTILTWFRSVVQGLLLRGTFQNYTTPWKLAKTFLFGQAELHKQSACWDLLSTCFAFLNGKITWRAFQQIGGQDRCMWSKNKTKAKKKYSTGVWKKMQPLPVVINDELKCEQPTNSRTFHRSWSLQVLCCCCLFELGKIWPRCLSSCFDGISIWSVNQSLGFFPPSSNHIAPR